MLLRNWLASAEKPCWHPHDLTFVFTTSRQEVFPCWWSSSDMLKSHISQHIFLTQEECKWELNNFFSHCIILTACPCLHGAARFMTFKEQKEFVIKEVKKAEIMKTVKSAHNTYTRSENPFDDRHRTYEINYCLYLLCTRNYLLN